MAKPNTTPNKTEKKYDNNPTIVTFFPTKNGNGNLVSASIDGKAYDTIQKSIQLGTNLLLKKAKDRDGNTKKTKNGTEYYFLEVLPPRENTNSDI
jgi:hypothetical protein